MLIKFLSTHSTLIIAAVLIPIILLLTGVPGLGAGWAAGDAARAQIEAYYARIIKDQTDLQALAHLAAYAAQLSDADGARFMWLMNGLILDTPATPASNWLSIVSGPWSRVRHILHAHWSLGAGSPALARFGSTGFCADDGSNQVQHVWYSVAVAYCWGAPLADFAARYHEWNAPGLLRHLPGTGGGRGTAQDLALSRQGIALGRALAEGTLAPQQVPGWLLAQLGTVS